METASRGEGLVTAVAHSHVSSLPSEQSPSPWGVVRRYRQWRSLLWNGGERGKQDESSPLLVLWFTATTAGILGRRSYRCSIWVLGECAAFALGSRCLGQDAMVVAVLVSSGRG